MSGASNVLLTTENSEITYGMRGHVYSLNVENATGKGNIPVIFQNGVVPEVGRNGWQNEELLAVLIDRMKFLNEKFSCRENSIVITKLEEALMWLEKRTAERKARGVEGKHVI